MILVLVTNGKNDSVDYVKVVTFQERFLAEKYITHISTDLYCKHWIKAKIVKEGEQVELYPTYEQM